MPEEIPEELHEGKFRSTLAVGFVAFIAFATFITSYFSNRQESLNFRSSAATPTAVIAEQTVTGSTVTKNATSLRSSSITGGTNKLFLASVSIRGQSTAQITRISGLGLSWSKVKSQCSGKGTSKTEVWRAYGNATSGAVTVTLGGGSRESAVISVTRYSGVNPISPIGKSIGKNSRGINSTSCSGGSDAASYSVNLTTKTARSMIYGAVSLKNIAHTPGSGYTELSELHTSKGRGLDAGLATEQKLTSSTGSYAVNGSMASKTDYAVVAVEIRPGTSGTAAPTTQTSNPRIRPASTCTSSSLCNGIQGYWNFDEINSNPETTQVPRVNSVDGKPNLVDGQTLGESLGLIPSGRTYYTSSATGLTWAISNTTSAAFPYIFNADCPGSSCPNNIPAKNSPYLTANTAGYPQRGTNGAFAISGWFRPFNQYGGTSSYNRIIADKRNATTSEYRLTFSDNISAGTKKLILTVLIEDQTGVQSTLYVDNTGDFHSPPLWFNWGYFAAGYDNTTNSLYLKLNYLPLVSKPVPAGYSLVNLSDAVLNVGGKKNSSGTSSVDFSDMWLDEVGIWSRWITPSEITTLQDCRSGSSSGVEFIGCLYPFDGSVPPTSTPVPPTTTPVPPTATPVPPTNTPTPTSPPAINGSCSVPPTHYNCEAGTLGYTAEYPDQWQWWCNGINGGANVLCAEMKPPTPIPTSTPVPPTSTPIPPTATPVPWTPPITWVNPPAYRPGCSVQTGGSCTTNPPGIPNSSLCCNGGCNYASGPTWGTCLTNPRVFGTAYINGQAAACGSTLAVSLNNTSPSSLSYICNLGQATYQFPNFNPTTGFRISNYQLYYYQSPYPGYSVYWTCQSRDRFTGALYTDQCSASWGTGDIARLNVTSFHEAADIRIDFFLRQP